MKDEDILVGLDIGTTEVRCLIGSRPLTDQGSQFQVLGFGYAPNDGMQAGMITVCEDVSQAISAAIKQAELNTNCRIQSATVNINSSDLRSVSCQASVKVTSYKNRISELECNSVDDRARQSVQKQGRQIVQFFKNSYQVNQASDVTDPLGIQSETLGLQALGVTTSNLHVETIIRACEEAGITINDFSVSSMSVAQATYDKQNWESGVIVIDMGYSTINVIVIKDSKINYVRVFNFGGFHVTQDIAILLKIDLETAEFLKIHYAKLNHEVRGTKTVEFNGRKINFSPTLLSQVVTARWQEICQIIARDFKKRGYEYLPGGIILAGGASKTTGIEDFMQEALDTYVRIGQLTNFAGLTEIIADNCSYLNVAGLMAIDSGLQTQTRQDYIQAGLESSSRFLKIFKPKNLQ